MSRCRTQLLAWLWITRSTRRARGPRCRLASTGALFLAYPETLDRLKLQPNIEVRRLKTGEHMGGVLHAKYFIVDDREVYVGSQNFDWRALTHIQELGLWDLPELVRLIDGAVRAVNVQLLTYRAVGHDGEYFDQLESALKRAAAPDHREATRATDWGQHETARPATDSRPDCSRVRRSPRGLGQR